MQDVLTSLSGLLCITMKDHERSIGVFVFHNIGSETTAWLISFPIFENPMEGMVTTCHKGYRSGLCTSCSSGVPILRPKK